MVDHEDANVPNNRVIAVIAVISARDSHNSALSVNHAIASDENTQSAIGPLGEWPG